MKKTYIKPVSSHFCFIEPLTQLCTSFLYSDDGSQESNEAWSNKKENNIWGENHNGPWGE